MDKLTNILLAVILAILVLGGTYWIGRDNGMKEASIASIASSASLSSASASSASPSSASPSNASPANTSASPGMNPPPAGAAKPKAP